MNTSVIASAAKQSIFAAKCWEEDGLLRCARNDGVGRALGRFNTVRTRVRKKFFFEKKNQKTFLLIFRNGRGASPPHAGSIA